MNNESLRDVYVGGVGMIKFGRYPEENVATLGRPSGAASAGRRRDAVERHRDDGCRLSLPNQHDRQKILKEIGMTGIPVYNVANACATGSTAFREAYFAVGFRGVRHRPGGRRGADGQARPPGRHHGRPRLFARGVMGTGTMPGVFGMAGLEHSRQYGTTIEQFAQVSVKNHEHAMANPLSHTKCG